MKTFLSITIIASITVMALSFSFHEKKPYAGLYHTNINQLKQTEEQLIISIEQADLSVKTGREYIAKQIGGARLKLKAADFWLRYFDGLEYKKLNGPLPVEWEVDVKDKSKKPERTEGAGLSLAQIELNKDQVDKKVLIRLIKTSLEGLSFFQSADITDQLRDYRHFYLANRLFLLNLAAIYTTGFECPDTSAVVPELLSMLSSVKEVAMSYNLSFSSTALPVNYLQLYEHMIDFVNHQPADYSQFDHFTFIKDYVNPLFTLNQNYLRLYQISSNNENDRMINDQCESIFSKSLFRAQEAKGIFADVRDERVLSSIRSVGKLLFYDPLLSGNNERSCASCHKSGEYFTDTAVATALQFDKQGNLSRNTPSLVNVIYNHLLMLDGKHVSMQNQAEGVMTSHVEMNATKKEIVNKIMSCPDYKKAFTSLLSVTPLKKEVSFEHIISAITMYYASFSNYDAPFDDEINRKIATDEPSRKGFNLFMSRALCATCHFVPQFNGVKPPYTGSEFEVLGVPADTTYKTLSGDKGRYDINPAEETMNAFRTSTVRNAEYTKPYMHNGIFNSLDEVIDFYDGGGGAGHRLKVDNQTLPSDSLRLSKEDKKNLLSFIHSLNEKIPFEEPPAQLPASSNPAWNNRVVGGKY